MGRLFCFKVRNGGMGQKCLQIKNKIVKNVLDKRTKKNIIRSAKELMDFDDRSCNRRDEYESLASEIAECWYQQRRAFLHEQLLGRIWCHSQPDELLALSKCPLLGNVHNGRQ